LTKNLFDRWGELIFQTESVSNPWNGKYKGKDVQEGVYVWKMKVKRGKSSDKLVGHVTVIR
jgi:gliding motility-associated-like protein